MKKILNLLGIIIVFALTSVCAFASDNVLSAVTLEGTVDGYNVTLKTAEVSKVKKEILSSNSLILTLKGVRADNSVNVIYKNTPAASGVIVETAERGDMKIHINAENIENSNVIFDIPAAAHVILPDSEHADNYTFNLYAAIIFAGLVFVTKSLLTNKSRKERKLAIMTNIKERELELYRNYSRRMNTSVSINPTYKRFGLTENPIPKGYTIRHYEMAKK